MVLKNCNFESHLLKLRKMRVAVVGATGMVGNVMLQVLREQSFPITELIPVASDNYRYNITGWQAGYEVGDKSPGAVSKVLGSIFNPADFLYNVFGKRPKEMKKLKEMKKDDTVRNLLATKFDRETLAALLEINKDDIPLILENCNYSEYFIKTANDLQIMDAISSCYEEYKVLKKSR